jgi:hypothetical protein
MAAGQLGSGSRRSDGHQPAIEDLHQSHAETIGAVEDPGVSSLSRVRLADAARQVQYGEERE